MKKLILLATAIAVATPVLPLDAQQTVRVTGSSRVDRDSYDKYYDDDQSAIGLTRTADYFVKPIYVNSDSREREVRSQEVDAMLTAMIAKAQEEDITLVAGKYTLSPLTQSSRKDLLTYGRGNRPDTTRVRLFARLPVGGKFSGVDEVDEAILAFYKSIPATGRSYVETGGTELAIDNPQQYRRDVVGAIAAEAKRYAAMFGNDYGIEIRGLDSELYIQQSSQTELFLYIEHSFVIKPK